MIQCSSNKKVGVITLPGDFNYGGKLQLFSVMHLYMQLGYTPEYLVLNCADKLRYHPKQIAKKLLKRPINKNISFEEAQTLERHNAFLRFGSAIKPHYYSSPQEIDINNFAYFSVGSDQVWNPNFIFLDGNARPAKRMYLHLVDGRAISLQESWFFLEFADRGQRIALAPSIGLDNLDTYQARRLSRGVKGFDRLSVRERRGAELIKEMTGKDAEVLCDPTLATEKEAWIDVADDRLTPSSPYIFAYILGEETAESEAALRQVTLNGSIPVIELSDQSRPGEPDAGPSEFISLVMNAQCVVTDSFHASVFASIFEKPLVIVHRGGEGQNGMFSRIETLSSMIGIKDKIYQGAYDASAHADYEGVASAIARERERFLGYLNSVLD